MTTCIDLADYKWLTGSEAAAVLEDLAANAAPVHTLVAQLRKRFTATQTHLLVEQADLRRRAAAKFARPHRMFFTRLGLEQSTDEWVAAYKSGRFPASRTPHVTDLCCGIGGDLLALAATASATGVDRDPIAAHFAAINSNATVQIKDVERFDLNTITAWHIDPDRRPGTRHGSRVSKRTTSLEYCEPNLATIEQLLNRVPHAAIKLAPATEVPIGWQERCEREWIGRDRECRQQVVWHGNLALTPGHHRATIIATTPASRAELVEGSGPPRTLVGQPKRPIDIADKPNRYVFDFDPAVLAAKLKGALAAEHELSALGGGPTYFTGPRAIADAALTCFEVDDVAPFRVTKLAKWLRTRNIGELEIKKRGVDIDPEKLRRDLKLRGSNSATLLITPIAAHPTAILARRIPVPTQ